MKKLLVILGGAIVLVAQWVYYFHYTPALNKYQSAQQSTVLLVASHCQGSGFVIQRNNRLFVWTAAHVVHNENILKVHQIVRFEGSRVGVTEFSADVIARDESLDVALLWLHAPTSYFHSIHFSHHDNLPVGTPVFHCGNFLGNVFDGSISTGIISQVGVHPDATNWPWPIADQTTAVAMPGSSGGPVFESDGSVIGILVGHSTSCVEFYVPMFALNMFANEQGVRFAFSYDYCPSDEQLRRLILSAHTDGSPNPDND